MISTNSFDFISVIGRGSFGRVWSVLSKRTLRQYALKEISKIKVIDKKSVQNILTERSILSYLNHPFFANLHYSFQDTNNLYLVLDFLPGGDLRYHLIRHKRFSETQSKFITSCVLLSLEHLHSNGIVHRDLKPENILLDNSGYCYLTDFGIAKQINDLSSKSASGTLGYIAPEALYKQEQSYTIDYFALGVMCFEMMNGHRPYAGKNRKELKENIMAKQVHLRKNDVPNGWSAESADFVNKLLQRKPFTRLGMNGVDEIKNHFWLKDVQWKDVYLKRLKSEFVPKEGDNYDSRYCNVVDKIDAKTKERYSCILADKNYAMTFREFLYFARDDKSTQCEEAGVDVVYPHKKYEQEESNVDTTNSSNNNSNNSSNGNAHKTNIHIKDIDYSHRDSNVVVDMLLDKYSSPLTVLSTNTQTEALSNRIRRQQSFDVFNKNYPGLMMHNCGWNGVHGKAASNRTVSLLGNGCKCGGGVFHRGCSNNKK